jgi:hypothetical protein
VTRIERAAAFLKAADNAPDPKRIEPSLTGDARYAVVLKLLRGSDKYPEGEIWFGFLRDWRTFLTFKLHAVYDLQTERWVDKTPYIKS